MISDDKVKKNNFVIAGIVSLYKPTPLYISNIDKYADKLDICFLIDDSGNSNKELFMDFLQKHPNTLYISNKDNIGLCKSVNIGLKKSYEYGADWVLIMDQDGEFNNDIVQIFRNYILTHTSNKVAIIAPQLNYDRHPRKSKKGYRKIKYPDLSGCLFNISILHRLNYLDENTYFYGLDVEYCIRVRKEGYKIIECSEAVLNHHPAETRTLTLFGKCIFKYGFDKPIRYYYQFRVCYYIYKKYGLIRSFRTILFFIYRYLKVILLFENKKEYLKMIRQGIYDAKRGFYGKYDAR